MTTLKEKLESRGKPYYDWKNNNDNQRLYSDKKSYNITSAFEMAKNIINNMPHIFIEKDCFGDICRYEFDKRLILKNEINPITGKSYPNFGIFNYDEPKKWEGMYLAFAYGLYKNAQMKGETPIFSEYFPPDWSMKMFVENANKIGFPLEIIESVSQIDLICKMYPFNYDTSGNKDNNLSLKLYFHAINPRIIETKEQKKIANKVIIKGMGVKNYFNPSNIEGYST